MTREEAIRFGGNILKVADETTDADAIEFTNMAIEAFKQEQSGDAISRQAALVSIKNLYPDMPVVDIMNARRKWLEKYAPYFECENAIEQLPSVNPQEPMNRDCVSRDYLLRDLLLKAQGEKDVSIKWLEEYINSLPLVTPQESKTGHWISRPHIYGVAFCSKCGFELKINNTNYCPNCGAKMTGESKG